MILLVKDERAARAWTEKLLRLGAEVKPSRALRGGAALRVSGAPPRVALEAASDPSVLDVLDAEPVADARLARATGEPRAIELAPGLRVGGGELVLAAGPCAVEDEATLDRTAERLARLGVPMLRAGAFKPRTSPYAFRGLGARGLEILGRVARRHGLLVVTEVLDAADVPRVAEVASVLQIGARSMQSFALLEAVGRAGRPVLLKRHPGASYEEWLLAAEYVLAAGEPRVILCERGVRTFTDHTRNTLDLSVVPAVKRLSHLPIIVDPSHGTGKRHKVIPLARAAVAVGADGIMVEVHSNPEKAMSDGPQSLYPEQFKEMLAALRLIAAAVGRTLS